MKKFLAILVTLLIVSASVFAVGRTGDLETDSPAFGNSEISASGLFSYQNVHFEDGNLKTVWSFGAKVTGTRYLSKYMGLYMSVNYQKMLYWQMNYQETTFLAGFRARYNVTDRLRLTTGIGAGENAVLLIDTVFVYPVLSANFGVDYAFSNHFAANAIIEYSGSLQSDSFNLHHTVGLGITYLL